MDRCIAYVGTYTNGDSKGIYTFDINKKEGRMFQRNKVAEIENPTYLCLSSSGKILYSVEQNGVASFRIQANGDLKFMNKQKIEGKRPCHVSVDCNDKFLFAAGYHDGKTTILRLNQDGSIGEVTDELYHQGHGADPVRQEAAHVHCVRLTPEEQGLCVVDLGIDQIVFYDFDKETGKGSPFENHIVKEKAGSGPRHVEFDKFGRFAYVVHELQNYISVYEIDYMVRRCKKLQEISTLPPGYEVPNLAAAVKRSPDGKFLYATNRGHNSIAAYSIDESTGLLTLCSILPVSGDDPRDMAVFPNGKYLVSANQTSNSLTLFKFAHAAGNFVLHGQPISVPSPVCIVMKRM